MIGWVFVLCVTVYFAFKYSSVKQRLKFFEEHGIAHIKPTFLVGNMMPFIMKKKHLYHMMKEYGERFGNDKYFGFFEFLKPILVITDADLVKEIAVKSFGNFMNRRELNHAIMDRDIFTMLTFLIDDDWRKIRAQSDLFFTKSKAEDFYPILMEHVDFMMKYYEKIFREKVGVNDNGIYVEPAAVLTNNLVTGIITSQLYGEEINTFENKNNKLLSRIGKYTESLNTYDIIMRMLGWTLVPQLMGKFNIRVFSMDDTDFVFDAFSNAIDKRLKDNTHRADFCQTVVDLINKNASMQYSDKKINKEDAEELIYKVKTQALVILLAGIDTSAAISCNLLYELTKNTEVQNKLRAEIDSTIAQHGEYPSWEVIGHMRYLEMVVAEALRKWPQTFEVLHRCCNIETLIEAPRDGAKPHLIRKGDSVWLSTVAMHYNKRYWKNPEIFDPERFNEVNRPKIYPYSYIPFGLGPRICIGFRFVPLIMKSMAFHLLAKYELVRTEGFKENLDYLADSLTLKTETCNIGIRQRLHM